MTTPFTVKECEASDLMTTHVHTVMVDDTIQHAICLMIDNQLTTLPVVSGENGCIGMLSRSDLNELFLDEDSELSRMSSPASFSLGWLNSDLDTLTGRHVQEFMTMDVTKIHSNAKLREICQVMAKEKVHHLPVVDDQERLAGIISAFDVVAAIAEEK